MNANSNSDPIADAESSAMHRELVERARRFAPRYDPAYWRCPLCDLGATTWEHFAGADYAVCEPCSTRHEIGERMFDPRGLIDEDGHPFPSKECLELDLDPEHLEQLDYEAVVWLANLHDLDTTGALMFRNRRNGTDPNDRVIFVDYWEGSPVSADLEKVGTAPIHWRKALSAPSRPLVYGVLLMAAAGGATRANPYPAWYLLRSFSQSPEDFGVTGPDADLLRTNYVTNPMLREKWIVAEREVTAAGGTLFLADGLHRLTRAGGLLETLRRQRDELTAQIEVLERKLGVTGQEREGAAR
jgi:hypothetical protein